MAVFENLKVMLGESLEKSLRKLDPKMGSYRILKKSLDARRKDRLHHVYTVETFASSEAPPYVLGAPQRISSAKDLPTTTVIGAGPAGLFAALWLLEKGMPCQIIERGKPVLPRMKDISKHWRHGQVQADSNVCFGEGGAGAFSDGKLITRIKSPYKQFVMEQMVRFGAPDEILYLANPHVGSNKIRTIINNLTRYLSENGCPIHFETRAEEFRWEEGRLAEIVTNTGEVIRSDNYVLATGHSAHDVYEKLFAGEVPCETLNIAMGFRAEHPQTWVNEAQYGSRWEHPELPVANYKLTCHDDRTSLGVYSFCMCPGGYVLASSAQQGRMVVNGMSNYNHGSPYANSGIVVTVQKDKWFPGGAREGLKFQEDIERKTQQKVIDAGGTIQVPAQRVEDFLANRVGPVGKSSCPSGVIAVNLRDIYPKELTDAFVEALHDFNRKMPGYVAKDALLHGVESRTSSPVRVIRDDKTLASPKYTNLYPSGEGAGFAGGITSAAVDGIRVAQAICETVG
ncbi:MAG: FAD-dependent protein [Bdellovibrionota bacterium]